MKKKDTPGKVNASTTENTPFFDKNSLFVVRKRVKIKEGKYYCWILKRNKEQIITNRVLQQSTTITVQAQLAIYLKFTSQKHFDQKNFRLKKISIKKNFNHKKLLIQ